MDPDAFVFELQASLKASIRNDYIEYISRKIFRLRIARFYFISDKLEIKLTPLPDTRSHFEYFKLLERNDKYPEKTKIRKTIENIVLYIQELKDELNLSDKEEKVFQSACHLFRQEFYTNFKANLIIWWPRIYVIYNEKEPEKSQLILVPELYNDNRINNDMKMMPLPDIYREGGKIQSEIDYNAEPTMEEISFKGHPPNKFSYKKENINLEFIKNLTPDIRKLINKKIKVHFKSKNCSGFSGHHIIPRKKLEIFQELRKQYFLNANELLKYFGLFAERTFQFGHMVHLASYIQNHGLLETVKPYKSQASDLALSPAGNIFYGPQSRADDKQSAVNIDNAAALVLSDDEYKLIISLDADLNEYLLSCGFELTDEFFQSPDIANHIAKLTELFGGINDPIFHNIEKLNAITSKWSIFNRIAENHGLLTQNGVISFDPRLVDQIFIEGVSKWVYRDRRLAEKCLPEWFYKLLVEVMQESGVQLEYDLNLNPVRLRPDDHEIKSFILRRFCRYS